MSPFYLLALAGVVVLVVAASAIAPARLVASCAARLSRADTMVLVLGLAALALHCGAMFSRSAFDSVPVFRSAVAAVDALGPVSMIAFAVPAAAVVIALRSVRTVVVVIVAVSLVAVGVTMYDAGPLDAHLTAIFVAVVLIALASGCGLSRRLTSRGKPA